MRKEAFYPILFSALTFLGTVRCSGSQESEALNEPDQDLKGLLQKSPQHKLIYDRARQRNLGFVLVALENIEEEVKVNFTRVDINSGSDELDHQEILAAPGTDSIFVATSCTGRYRIQISFIGGEYQSIPVPDLFTRELRNTFTLRPSSCSRPIIVIFPKAPQV